MYHIIVNKKSRSGRGEKLWPVIEGELERRRTEFRVYPTKYHGSARETAARLTAKGVWNPDDVLLAIGGDGTANEAVDGITSLSDVKFGYIPTGSGNDFLHDLGKNKGDAPFCINEYVRDLPSVTVNGKDYLFLNGIGYGIDGYCCEVGDQHRLKSDKPVNYTSIAIKGLLFHYRRTTATVTVDGNEFKYRGVWLAPTMNGRFYGGGMMTAPSQDRLNPEHTLSAVVMYGSNKLKTLMVFPSIFKGEHVKHTEMVEVHTGRDITVKFNRPTALQIDGETILGVTEYTAHAFQPAYAEK